MADVYRHLTVELELGSQTLRGSVSGEGRSAARFEGWLELVGAIEATRPHSDEIATGEREQSTNERGR